MNQARFHGRSIGHRTPTFTTIVRPVRTGVVTANNKPVQSADFLNGALYVANRHVRNFSAAEVELQSRLARLVSAALARTLDQTRLQAELSKAVRLAADADHERSLLRHAQDIRRQLAAGAQDRVGISGLCVAMGIAVGAAVFVTEGIRVAPPRRW